MSKSLKIIILCAVILRLFISTFFYHPDLRVYYFHGQFLSQGIIDIYRYLDTHRFSLPNSNPFNYPPLAYFLYGGLHSVSQLIAGPSLNEWLNDWGGTDIHHPQLYFFLLLLKSPYFIIDLLCLTLLLSLTAQPKNKLLLAVFWLFNPLILYGTYAVGQFDLLPVFFTLLALKSARNNQLNASAFFLIIGGLLKSYPLLFLPFVLIRQPTVKKFLGSAFLSTCLWLVPQLPFITSQAYSTSVLNSGLANRIFSSVIDLGSGIAVAPFIAYYLIVFLVSVKDRTRLDLTAEFFAVSLAVILFAPFHAQWLMWSLPFGLLLFQNHKEAIWPAGFALLAATILIGLLPDKYVFTAQLSALTPALATIPPLAEILTSTSPDLVLKLHNVFRTVLIVCGLWLTFMALKLSQSHAKK